MVKDFVCLRQQPGSKSCLPTAVRAILLYYGYNVFETEVPAWCDERTDGCWLDLAMQGLRDYDFDVRELLGTTEDIEGQIKSLVNDREDPLPVLVTLRDLFAVRADDHAVVVVGVDPISAVGPPRELVFFMDPITGQIEQDEY